MKVLKSAVTDVKVKNAFVVSIVKNLRAAKDSAENRMTLAKTAEEKAYYKKLLAEYEQDIQAAINCYITVY